MPRNTKAAKAIIDRFPNPDETIEMIVDSIGRVRVMKMTSARGSRLVVTMSLEDDTLRKARDPAKT